MYSYKIIDEKYFSWAIILDPRFKYTRFREFKNTTNAINQIRNYLTKINPEHSEPAGNQQENIASTSTLV